MSERKVYLRKMKSKGLGDDIEKFTKFTGIKRAVDIVADKFNKDCGCDQRRDSLNRLFPYKKIKNGISKITSRKSMGSK